MWADAACLFLITVLTAVPYLSRLGFYSDDWLILANFHFDTLHHRFGLSSALSGFEARPLQGLYLALLYKFFGFHAFFYHLVNTMVIGVAIAIFYFLLVRMNVGRARALAAAMILIILPQLSTVRVWYAAFQIPLSMVAALVSLHCQLSFARTGKWGWAIAAALAALISLGLYEIFAPLIAAFPIALATVYRRGPTPKGRRSAVGAGIVAVLLGAVAASKILSSDRVRSPEIHLYTKGLIQLFRPDYDWRTDYALNIFAATSVHFWWPLLAWLRQVPALFQGQVGVVSAAVALVTALACFLLLGPVRAPAVDQPGDSRLLVLGAAAFVLGHAVFLIAPAMFFSPAGIANRALVAAAIGVALIFAAGIGYVSDLFNSRLRPLVFAGIVALVMFLGTLRILQITNYWAEVPPLQARVVSAARSDLKNVPAQSMIMLDNVCPYHGPGVVFEGPWDISGALELALGRPIHGDAVSPRMSLQSHGLATSIYGEKAFYPFGAMLYVYDPARRRVTQIENLDAARAYFRISRSGRTPCPRSYVGQGVLI